MAKTVTAVSGVNEAAGDVVLAESATSPARAELDVPERIRHLYPRRVAQAVAAAEEEPLPATGAAPGFSILGEIAVNNGPIAGVVASADGAHLLVANHGQDSVSVIDTATFDVVHAITGTPEPFALAADQVDYDRVYVSTVSTSYDSIAVIDTASNSVVATHPLAYSVTGLVTSPDGKRVYAGRTRLDGADIAVIDTTSDQIGTIDVVSAAGTAVAALAISPDGLRLYTGTVDQSGGALVVIDAEAKQVVDVIGIGAPVRGVAVSNDGGTGYVATCDPVDGGALHIVDTGTNEVSGTVEFGGLLTEFTLNRAGDRAYVVIDDHIAVLCLATYEVVDWITVGAQPSCLTESADGELLYVADYSGVVTVLAVESTTAPLRIQAAV